MTYQEILESITRHRANPLITNQGGVFNKIDTSDLRRKFDEIEWALQALAEKLRDDSNA
jgi:hypothetical protein